MIRTTAPGLSTVPAAGSWVSTVCGTLALVVVTAGDEVVVDEDGMVVVVGLPTE